MGMLVRSQLHLASIYIKIKCILYRYDDGCVKPGCGHPWFGTTLRPPLSTSVLHWLWSV